MSSRHNLKPLKSWVRRGSSGSAVSPRSWAGAVSGGMLSRCPDLGVPGPEQWSCVLCCWAGRSNPLERGTLGEGTAGRLGFVSCYVLPMPAAPRLTVAAEQAGWLVMGKWVFVSAPWGWRVLSPPSFVKLLGIAVSVDNDLAPELPVPLAVWHQAVSAAVCPFLQHALGKEGHHCGQGSNVSSSCYFKAS